ncbi:translesion error-prone DNA polymerase V autoproteolytic subunit [Alishewanella sp. 16-MA]|uniref:Translesion error-prone DNA polymerase V autoproteolytic subunit n=1 Tax=Alishewanella maricola TaxID=2795740 RepID=A0ABS8C6V4_9ALTE|nr:MULTISPECIES: translesion error-prone DNA polymerase V autoproteolytic subunit [Alishewanella]MDP4944260.1 translesion error-prone DNA polymerase V autoproteolytic subunit [Alishewanella sp.]MCB5228026.1 translesion error-prone DNA polymerase V autoproteolytic subunit [Alishewanella maricola]MDP5034491.1 translesion error-prone DNA polymerase V autoproteolytic subunit [Alishewanella sp.]MDP5187923.1 translesion error-prone DNA polymerase V autoproteolytic subunit [Alishewanella sp.]MDP54604
MSVQFLGQAQAGAPIRLPFFSSKVPAGFPSPAQDYIEQSIDLNQLCIHHPTATFFVRVSGDSMIEAGIFEDDVLVVDRAITAEHGDIVVASINGEFTVKRLSCKMNLMLLPENPRYQPVHIKNADELQIFGVVTNAIRRFNRK